VGEERNYRVRVLAIPSSGSNGQPGNLVTARYYEAKRGAARPLVIVLPIWGIHDYPSETLARDLRDRSGGTVDVLLMLGERPLFDWSEFGGIDSEAAFFGRVDRMVERFVATVIDIRRLIDWAQRRPEIDPQRIALVGFSMSAVVASVAIAHEPRLAAGVLVMGGADPHDVLAACNHEIEDARERILEQLDWSLEHFKGELRRALAAINPARFAGMTDPSRVLIIEAGADTCMPQSARDRLWHAFGRPERIAYRYDHRTAFLAMTFLGGYDLQRQVYRFLARAFAAPVDRQLTEDDGAPPGGPG
jgi:dienelactone hydrolase